MIEPFAAVKLPVLMVPVLKLPVLKLAAVKFVMRPFAAVKFVAPIVPAVMLPAVRLEIVAFAAVKFVIVPLAAVKFVTDAVDEVNPTELNAVNDPTVRLLTLKLLIDAVPIRGQFRVEFPGRPSPHCSTLTVPFANALCIGSVITNPELNNSVAKTPLILVCVVLCVVLMFVMSRP